METKSHFSEKVKDTIKQMEEALADVEKKIEEGAEDVKVFYQKEKEKLQERLQEKKNSWKASVDSMKKQLTEVETYILKLQEKVATLLKGGPDGFDLAKSEAIEIIDQLILFFEKIKGDTESGMAKKLDNVTLKLTQFRLQVEELTYQGEGHFEQTQQKMLASLEEILTRLKERISEKERIQQFTNEMGESFDHLKKAFKGLFS
jgi:phage-related minor tail protein